MKFCLQCANTRWVCEAHQAMPWEGQYGCGCGAPGEPCPICNKPDDGEVPKMPDGFVTDVKREW